MDFLGPSLSTLWLADLFLFGGGGALPVDGVPQLHVAVQQEHWRNEVQRYQSHLVVRTSATGPVELEQLEISSMWASGRSRPSLGAPLELSAIGPFDLVVLDDGSDARPYRVFVPLQVSPFGVAFDEDNQLHLTEIGGVGIGGEVWTALRGGRGIALRGAASARTQRLHQPQGERADWANELHLNASVALLSRDPRRRAVRLWADTTWRFEPRDDLGGRDGVDGRSLLAGLSYAQGVDSDWTERLHPPVIESFSVDKTDCGTLSGTAHVTGRRSEVQLLVNDVLVQTWTAEGDHTEAFEVPWPTFSRDTSSVVSVSLVAGTRTDTQTVSLAPDLYPTTVRVTLDDDEPPENGIVLHDPRPDRPVNATLNLFPQCDDRSGLAVDITLGSGDEASTTDTLISPAYGADVTLAPTLDHFLVKTEVAWKWHGWPAGESSTSARFGDACVDSDGDGFTQCDGDCQNADPAVHPDASDIVGDNIDNNCDGINGQDADQDGFEAAAVGGKDCDDNNPSVHPNAMEVPYNGIDEDCSALTRDDDLDGDGFMLADDCADDEATIYPGALETWDCVDQDCDGIVDNGVIPSDDPLPAVTTPEEGLLYDTWGQARFDVQASVVGQPGADDWFVFSTMEHDPWSLNISISAPSARQPWEVELVRLVAGEYPEPLPVDEWSIQGGRITVGSFNSRETPSGLMLYDGTRTQSNVRKFATDAIRILGGPVGWFIAEDMDDRFERRNRYHGHNAGLYAVRVRPGPVEAQSCPATLSITHD